MIDLDTKVKDLINDAMSRIHEMADANTMMGTPVKVDGVTVIPVSKVSYGFAGGGSDLPTKSEKECFGGGTGGGITLQPLGFLVVAKGDVRFIQINTDSSKTSAVINMVPELLTQIKSFVGKKDENSDSKDAPTGKEDTLDAVDDMKTEDDFE